jgi:PKD repeat protein
MRTIKPFLVFGLRVALIACLAGIWMMSVSAQTATGILRIVSYNIDCADQSSDANITGPAHSLPTVLEGIGLHHLGANVQHADILNVEELQSTTLNNFTTALNNIYGAGAYAFDPTVDTNTGGGPDGLIYNTKTVQVISGRCLPTGETVLLQSNGVYASAHSPGGGKNGVPRGPLCYLLRPIGYGTNNDFYLYISHARSTSDDSSGDARYAEAQEVRSDAKYKLPANSHILYAGDWNLFNGSGENAYKCLTGQTTSDGVNWADTSSVWANSNPTQGYDPTSKTSPPTTTTFANASSDHAGYLYDDSTDAGEFATSSRLDIQLPNALMYGVYNSQGGVQLTPNTSDPYDVSNFPASQYSYAFEVFGNNGSIPFGDTVTYSGNNSLADLASTVPNSTTVINDIIEVTGANFTGSDHYPIFGDYTIVVPPPPVAAFTASPTNGVAPLTVNFTDASTGSVTSWKWTFGDGSGSTSIIANPTYTFTNAGNYTITETVTGPGGSNSTSQIITALTPYQAWQLQYFGCDTCPQSLTNADADGTGQNNEFKYVAGLNPTNPASIFTFNAQGTNLVFSPMVAGRTYTALYSVDLTSPDWQPLTTAVTNITGSTATITDTGPALAQKFYIIEISGP